MRRSWRHSEESETKETGLSRHYTLTCTRSPQKTHTNQDQKTKNKPKDERMNKEEKKTKTEAETPE
ncbi:hypothetical protein G97194_004749 [Escherichia coli]|nr:hypothetical protein G97194_004749 [Escherichia coli]